MTDWEQVDEGGKRVRMVKMRDDNLDKQKNASEREYHDWDEIHHGKIPRLDIRVGVVTALLVTMSVALVDSAFRRSPSADEPFHLVRGLSFWWTGTSHLSYAHPPLANAVVAAPAALFFEKTDFTKYPNWKKRRIEGLSTHYMRTNYAERAWPQLICCRITMAFFSVLLAVYVFMLCRRQFGWWTGVLALLLVGLNPTMLAHGRLVTTDLPMAFAAILLIGEMVNYFQRSGVVPFIRLALVVSIALLTKYTAIPIVLFLSGFGAFVSILGSGRFSQPRVWKRLLSYSGQVLIIAAIALFAINAIYRFDRTFLTVKATMDEPEPRNAITSRYKDKLLEKSPLAQLPESLRIPLPYTYVFGICSVLAHAESGHSSWFWGEKSRNGNPFYFPLMLLIKTPVVYWIMLLIGIVGFALSPEKPHLLTVIAATTFIFFMWMIIPSKINIGFRHALPVVPILAVLAARGGVRGLSIFSDSFIGKIPSRILRHGIYFSLALLLIGGISSYPDFLGYFNTAVGRSLGHQISIIGEDWGQDAIGFAKYLKKKKIKELYYQPSNLGAELELKRNGVKFHKFSCRKKQRPKPKKPAYFAVHTSKYVRRNCLPKKGTIEEIDRYREHIILYRYWPD
jgi:hypothetical protein